MPTLVGTVQHQRCLTRVDVSIKIKYTHPVPPHTHNAHQSASFWVPTLLASTHPLPLQPLSPCHHPRGLCLFSTCPHLQGPFSARTRPTSPGFTRVANKLAFVEWEFQILFSNIFRLNMALLVEGRSEVTLTIPVSLPRWPSHHLCVLSWYPVDNSLPRPHPT